MNRSSHSFSESPSANIQRSVFDRSHGCKTTFDSGYLIPVFVDEALPGDTFNLNMTAFARMATPLFPIMDNLYMDSFFFAVPWRLVWEHWEQFNGSVTVGTGQSSTDYVLPTMKPTVYDPASDDSVKINSLSDYFGIPVYTINLVFHSCFHRAYNLIWNEWFRDQNLQDPIPVPLGDGPDSLADFPLQKRNKRHDYFTSCLPWPQKGPSIPILEEPGVFGVQYDSDGRPVNNGNLQDNQSYLVNASDPLGTNPFLYNSYKLNVDNFGASPPGGDPADIWNYSSRVAGGSAVAGNLAVPSYFQYRNASLSALDGNPVPPRPGLVVGSGYSFDPFNTAIPASMNILDQPYFVNTINSLRQAFQIQKMFERDARGGTRYTEIIRSHFGVVSPDARLQRPEYLGGSSSHINVNPVAQTSAEINSTTSGIDTTPQGSLAAFATTTHRASFAKSFTEHCLIIGMVSVRADLTYQQGLNRMFSRSTRFDFYWPALAHLGEQAVLVKELFAFFDGGFGSENNMDKVFGYQERYAEYRYKPSIITGLFRTNPYGGEAAWASLDAWHLAQLFDDRPAPLPGSIRPVLNSQFIEENVPMDRILATPTEPDFIFDSHFSLKCARPMPVYSIPGLVDHF